MPWMPSLFSCNCVQSFVAENSSGVRLNQKCCNKNYLTLLKQHKQAEQVGLHFSEPSSHLSCFLFFCLFLWFFSGKSYKRKEIFAGDVWIRGRNARVKAQLALRGQRSSLRCHRGTCCWLVFIHRVLKCLSSNLSSSILWKTQTRLLRSARWKAGGSYCTFLQFSSLTKEQLRTLSPNQRSWLSHPYQLHPVRSKRQLHASPSFAGLNLGVRWIQGSWRGRAEGFLPDFQAILSETVADSLFPSSLSSYKMPCFLQEER